MIEFVQSISKQKQNENMKLNTNQFRFFNVSNIATNVLDFIIYVLTSSSSLPYATFETQKTTLDASYILILNLVIVVSINWFQTDFEAVTCHVKKGNNHHSGTCRCE